MLLRSLTKHVKDQNWFAVALDFFIVVAGILIAFQITNWNEGRQEAEQQRFIETRLLRDFEFISRELETAETYSKNVIISLDTLRTAIKNDDISQDDETIKYALIRGYSHYSIVRHSPTYGELESSGRLHLIKDEALRIALARYDEQSVNRKFNQAQIRNIINIIDIYLLEHATLSNIDRNEIAISYVTDYDISAMAADDIYQEKLDRLISLMTWMHSNLIGQRQDVDKVLFLLNEDQ